MIPSLSRSDLVLVVHGLLPLPDVIRPGKRGVGEARNGFPVQLLEVQDRGMDTLDQGFVVGNKEDSLRTQNQELLQPFQGVDVQVIARFIQQQDVRVLHKQRQQEIPDFLSARERGKKLCGEQTVIFNAKACQDLHMIPDGQGR